MMLEGGWEGVNDVNKPPKLKLRLSVEQVEKYAHHPATYLQLRTQLSSACSEV